MSKRTSEAQACGTPVIGYAGGALPETIPGLGSAQPCGVHFHAQTPAAIADAVREFERAAPQISADACRENAMRFSPAHFRETLVATVDRAYRAHVDRVRRGRPDEAARDEDLSTRRAAAARR